MKAIELRQYTIKLFSAPWFAEPSPRGWSNLFDFCGGVFRPISLVWSPPGSSNARHKSAASARRPIPSHLAKQLQSVNVLAPTKMCRVMTKYGSDKGRANNYTPVYSALFKERCDQPLRIFELGLGTNNPDYRRTWGCLGHRGRPFADGGSFSRTHLCTGLTSIAGFCFRKIGSRHSIAISLTGPLSVSYGRTRICRAVWILSSRMAYILLKRTSPSWKSHSITFVRAAFTSPKILCGTARRVVRPARNDLLKAIPDI